MKYLNIVPLALCVDVAHDWRISEQNNSIQLLGIITNDSDVIDGIKLFKLGVAQFLTNC